uniref:5-oxoprolinase n=1 Tax=Parastrongyloides trichosuri TaxID=131310 RepID=A0A0N4ZHY2_PARTI
MTVECKKKCIGKLGFAIDRGGTFTDVICCFPSGEIEKLKLLSEDPSKYNCAPTEGIRRFVEKFTKKSIPVNGIIPTENIEWIRMGTTVATNALLERKGEKCALLVTKGFKDILHIGNQTRPDLFDLNIRKPDAPCDKVIEINERIILPIDSVYKDVEYKIDGVYGSCGHLDGLVIEHSIEDSDVNKQIENLKNEGYTSLGVSFLNSYAYPGHERTVEAEAYKVGFEHVSVSHKVSNMSKFVPRTCTTVTDAYLTPVVKKYIESFKRNFENNLDGINLEFMRSDGGLCAINDFIGCRAILSGPAGGVVGVSITAYNEETKRPVIGFDMGGTSTDVSRYAGEFEHTLETSTAGVTIQVPQMDICTVAAGGGSRLFFRDGRFIVGPESAGSDPGPVCYRKNGYLTITDANVVLRKIVPEKFPKIFGPNGDLSLDYQSAYDEFVKLSKEINDYLVGIGQTSLSVESIAEGFINVANEAMSRPIRTLTEGKGYNTAAHELCSFGGAGGQHCCAVAEKLGITKIKISPHSGLLSAYGIGAADTVTDTIWPYNDDLLINERKRQFLTKKIISMMKETKNKLLNNGFNNLDVHHKIEFYLRYNKTDSTIPVLVDIFKTDVNGILMIQELEKAKTKFEILHHKQFGFMHSERKVIVKDIRVIASAKRFSYPKIENEISQSNDYDKEDNVKCFFNGNWMETKCVLLEKLKAGNIIDGPALILDADSTIVIDPKCCANIKQDGSIEINVEDKGLKNIGVELNPIHLSIFSHRLMSIAEQMGKVLERTAISTNIKERLDFSCALFGQNGDLIANAPHIPVHLGGMQTAVKYLINLKGPGGIKPGEVILSNHPIEGGSHLPDLTVITPIFISNQTYPDFYVANRGHHSDIGGLVPGSMPPNSTTILEEGAVFKNGFTIVEDGVFLESKVIEALESPSKQPGCSGTRQLSDNLADLKAQIAANQKGISLLTDLTTEYGLHVVQAYMNHITENAETCVRDFLKSLNKSNLSAQDKMDDGTIIALSINVDKDHGVATFDFTGTGPQSSLNLNAPEGVVKAAVIYCIRCLVGREIPLNQGCLNPIKIIIPPETILSPNENAAVVGGNVLTSQRICDVILSAFEACAASHGCMNNITFGNSSMGGYYETIGGGAGAGKNFDGRSGVHTHMTNTRITDPEIVEARYPVIVREFSLRSNSGGKGIHNGGDGIIRKLQFRAPMTLSVLTERRITEPFGLKGGQPGKCGVNSIISLDGNKRDIGGKKTVDVLAGETLEIKTPGGGGYGTPSKEK